jgi:hypothetical protein
MATVRQRETPKKKKYYHTMALFLFLHQLMKAGGWYGLGEIHGESGVGGVNKIIK